jgi:uncharacterized membrane protein YgcG
MMRTEYEKKRIEKMRAKKQAHEEAGGDNSDFSDPSTCSEVDENDEDFKTRVTMAAKRLLALPKASPQRSTSSGSLTSVPSSGNTIEFMVFVCVFVCVLFVLFYLTCCCVGVGSGKKEKKAIQAVGSPEVAGKLSANKGSKKQKIGHSESQSSSSSSSLKAPNSPGKVIFF